MDEGKIRLLSAQLGHERLKVNESLKFYTQSQSEITVACLYIATSQNELVEILDLARELKIKFLVFGGGSRLHIANNQFLGIMIKNRSSRILVSGVKGKVGRAGLGIEEAMVEVDSGVSVGKLNEFLDKQGLRSLYGPSPSFSTIGSAVFLDIPLGQMCQKVKVWERGEIIDKEVIEINRKNDIVLSLTLKVKSKQ